MALQIGGSYAVTFAISPTHKNRMNEQTEIAGDIPLDEMIAANRPLLRQIIASRISERLAGRVDPSDVIQETLIEAHIRLNEYQDNPNVPFLTWLVALAEQNALLAHRKHFNVQKRSVKREQRLDDSSHPNDLQRIAYSDATDPGIKVERLEDTELLHKALRKLNPLSQRIVCMRYLEGRKLSEIAHELEMSVDAVAKRAIRSLDRLSEFANNVRKRQSN